MPQATVCDCLIQCPPVTLQCNCGIWNATVNCTWLSDSVPTCDTTLGSKAVGDDVAKKNLLREEGREGAGGCSLLSRAFRLASITSRALPAMLYALQDHLPMLFSFVSLGIKVSHLDFTRREKSSKTLTDQKRLSHAFQAHIESSNISMTVVLLHIFSMVAVATSLGLNNQKHTHIRCC